MQCPTILESVFRHFTQDNNTMNYQQFVSFAKDCKLFDKEMKKADSAAVFAESVVKSPNKEMSFASFKENLAILSNNKTLTRNDAIRKIESYGKNIFYVSYSRSSTMLSFGSLSGLSSPRSSEISKNALESSLASLNEC